MKFLKKFATAAMALLTLGGYTPPSSVPAQGSPVQANTGNNKQSDLTPPPAISQGMQLKARAGGFNVYGHDEGTPPKIYGTYYVKPRTHKRTNKKR